MGQLFPNSKKYQICLFILKKNKDVTFYQKIKK